MGLKETALDSPTFRSGFTHFSEQLELVEKWLDNYVRSIAKLSHEVVPLEGLINGYLAQSVPPTHVSEAVLDHDYTLLAMRRYGEGAKQFWAATLNGLKKLETNMVEPIRTFLQHELRLFKETRRQVEQSQKHLDSLLSRYSAQAKTKEASSLREDAFQVHEARKMYLKASMDFSVTAPQLRMALDKMLVKMFSDQWRDTQNTRQLGSLERWTGDIERVRGWSREMESGERTFKKELHVARKQIEESAEVAVRPSRELDDYSADESSVSRPRGPSATQLQAPGGKNKPLRPEKQGWLNLRTVSGKPSRTVWLRRWFYVKNGIFGWLVQGSRSGAVEESERIGVLLCSCRAANSDDRRYVFEVKTKDTTIVVQAETQPELNEWLSAFDVAKQKALEDPASTESPSLGPKPQDPAFAISPPSAPEFAASAADSGMPQSNDESNAMIGVDRSTTLPVPGIESKSSFDVSSPKRSTFEREGEGSTRERIMTKLDLHSKKANSAATGGIASLIAASHGSMPVGPGALPEPPTPVASSSRKVSTPLLQSVRDLPTSTLAPNTLANPPAPTNLSSTAVIVNGERGIGIGRDASGGIPSGLMANVWGSTNWGFLNRLERGELKPPQQWQGFKLSNPPSPMHRAAGSVDANRRPSSSGAPDSQQSITSSRAPSPHRKTFSLDTDTPTPITTSFEYPNYYPLQLKTQDAQFRLLFPNARRDEKVVLVFKATWNPNDQQDFPGRVYVTPREVYFYSNHCGMTMTTSFRLDAISDVTAASGRECDFVYLHLKQESPSGFSRVTIKTFLEPLRLLQRRLSFLVRNAGADDVGIEEVMKTLIKMEQDDPGHSPSVDSWENVSINTPIEDGTPRRQASHRDIRDLRANVLIDRGLYGDAAGGGKDQNKSFKLPKQPVLFVPAGMDRLVVEKEYEVSPKALFHVLFGDKSAVWQLLYHERGAQHIKMGPWTQPENGHIRREFDYDVEYLDLFRFTRKAKVSDHQIVDSATEHLLYVVSDRKLPWHLPYRNDFTLLTKVVITHVAKSRCKLAIYTKVDWIKSHFAQRIINHRALYDLGQDALDLADVTSDQCRRLGEKSRTKKAIGVFGQVGLQTQVSEFAGSDSPLSAQLRRATKPRSFNSLVFEAVASMLETIATSTLQIITDIVQLTWKTISANRIILTLLFLSILANLVYTSNKATDSWREQRASKYMSHLGIGPDLAMTKAIYFQDLEEATSFHKDATGNSSQCRSTFNDIVNLDLQTPSSPLGPIHDSNSTQSKTQTAIRLQRTRQTLASQRHDLLVAMRVVNSIEHEMVQAEWEHWLLGENAKCKQLGALIQRNLAKQPTIKPSKGQQQSFVSDDPRQLDQAREWYGEYCESCDRERALVGI